MKKRKKKWTPEPVKELKEYSVQATPLILRSLGWPFIEALAAQAYPGWKDADFQPLIKTPDSYQLNTGDGSVKVFFGDLSEVEGGTDRKLMIVPYRDDAGIKVLYFKWADESFYDSFSVPDGQNRIWDGVFRQGNLNRPKKAEAIT